MFKHTESGHPLLDDTPHGAYFGMPEFVSKRLDYESPGKSVNVVETPEGPGAKANGAGKHRGNRVGKI
ncbi:hypothetical protein GCM10017667_62060 [Streptomyces filamentosus]|uniref:Uncharacterized protein n=1 Tax=Streptomyces filamentosus TaxID=67294 RepID=A0A919BVN3_STRFL|nr:hypothetical protein GCM10017667_62060 [Streptomyces filamentosus]